MSYVAGLQADDYKSGCTAWRCFIFIYLSLFFFPISLHVEMLGLATKYMIIILSVSKQGVCYIVYAIKEKADCGWELCSCYGKLFLIIQPSMPLIFK